MKDDDIRHARDQMAQQLKDSGYTGAAAARTANALAERAERKALGLPIRPPESIPTRRR